MSDYTDIVHEWASETRAIQRVWIIGSRARGDHRPDSDLDVWVEAWPGEWIFDNKKWKSDLQRRLKTVRVHLVEHQGKSSELAKKVENEADLIYSATKQ